MRVFELAPPPPTVPKSFTKCAGVAPSSNIPHHALPAALKPLASAQPRRGDTVEMVEVNEPVRNDEERGTGAGRPTTEETDHRLPQCGVQQDTSEHADGANGTVEEISAAANGEHDDWRGENGHGGVNGNTAKKDLPPLHGQSVVRERSCLVYLSILTTNPLARPARSRSPTHANMRSPVRRPAEIHPPTPRVGI